MNSNNQKKNRKNYKLLYKDLFKEYRNLGQKYDTLKMEFYKKEKEKNERNIHDEKNYICKNCKHKNSRISEKNDNKKIIYPKLERLKKSYYEFDNNLLPEIDNTDIISNINTINTFTNDINMINIKKIIEFYKIFEKFLNHISGKNIKKRESNFLEYIKYNTDVYSKKLYNKRHMYNKVQRCYRFINELKSKNISEINIIILSYKTGLTFNKLYELKEEEYNEFIKFLYEKINICLDFEVFNKVINKKYIKNRTKRNTQVLLNNYLGNKNYLLESINKYHDIENETYIYDLFGGSLTISNFFSKIYPENKIIVNEINKDIYNLYNLIIKDKNTFIKTFNKYNILENINNYSILINIYKETSNIHDKSVIYLLLNIIGYSNYIYYDTENNIKIFSLNSKYIKGDKIVNISEIENLLIDFCKYLEKIELYNYDILSNNLIIDKIKANDLVILDPPYDNLNYTKKSYNNTVFTRHNQEQLYLLIKRFHDKGCKILAFNNNTPFIRNLYKRFNYDIIESYNIPSHRYKKELLIYNY